MADTCSVGLYVRKNQIDLFKDSRNGFNLRGFPRIDDSNGGSHFDIDDVDSALYYERQSWIEGKLTFAMSYGTGDNSNAGLIACYEGDAVEVERGECGNPMVAWTRTGPAYKDADKAKLYWKTHSKVMNYIRNDNLDKPLGDNENNLEGIACPNCEQAVGIYLTIETEIYVNDDGTDFYHDNNTGRTEWDDTNIARCPGCGYEQELSMFRYVLREENYECKTFTRDIWRKMVATAGEERGYETWVSNMMMDADLKDGRGFDLAEYRENAGETTSTRGGRYDC